MSVRHLLAREKAVIAQVRAEPDLLTPEEALCAVVWPSPEFAGAFPVPVGFRAPEGRPCAGCGGDLNARTRGCTTCRERHKGRVRYERLRGATL